MSALIDGLGLPDRPRAAAKGDPVSARVRAHLDAQVRVLAERGARADCDPEDVHRMRVAVRRARTALRVGRGSIADAPALRTELTRLDRALGAVRDLDALLDRLRTGTAAFDQDERVAADVLLHVLVLRRRAARRRATVLLRGKRHHALLRALAAVATSPAPEGGPDLTKVIGKAHRTLMRRAASLGSPTDEDLHDLRALGERLRYSAELAPGRKARLLVKATRAFQDVLGDLHDASAARARVVELLEGLGPAATTDVAFVAGRLVEREERRGRRCRDRWPAALAEVDRRARALLG